MIYEEDYAAGGPLDEGGEMLDEDFTRETAVVGWRPGLVDSGTLATLMEFAGSYGAEQRDGEHFHSRSMLTDAVGMDDRTDNRTMLRHMRPEGWTRLHSGATSHPSSHSTAPRHTLGCQRGTHLILRATVVLF